MKTILQKIKTAMALLICDEWVVFVKAERWHDSVHTTYEGLCEVEKRVEDMKWE